VLSTHCHDDLGLAAANSLAAIRAGARQVECTVNGIGERAGNASLEEIVMATRVRSDRLPFQTGVDTRLIYTASQLLTSITGEAVQANKAIVGRNAFAHEAGIHQDGMLKDRRTYEIMRPEEVGVPRATLVLGKHSGRHAVQKRCEELGCALSRFEIDRVYRRLMALADAQKQITDADLRRIVQDARAEALAAQSGVEALAAHGYGHGV
jgi:2-isopropylmalate synthase